MLPQCSHITRKRGVFYWRRRLPGRDRGEVAISLRTRRFREAEHRAALLTEAFGAAWTRATVEADATGKDLQTILREHLRAVLDGDLPGRLPLTSLIRAFEATERFLLGWNEVDRATGQTRRRPGAIERIGEVFRDLGSAFDRIRTTLRPLLGDCDALDAAMVTIAAITFAPLITALTVLGTALLTTPAGLAITAIGALALAAVAIRRNWGGIGEWFGEQMDALKRFGESSLRSLIDGPLNSFRAFAGELREAWGGIATFFTDLFEGIERRATALRDAIRSLLDILPRPGGSSPTGSTNDPAAQSLRSQNWGSRGTGENFYGPRRMNFMGPASGVMDGGLRTASYSRAEGVNVGGQVLITVADDRVRVAASPDSDRVDWSVIQRGRTMMGT